MIRKAAMMILLVALVFAVASCSDDSSGPKDKEAPEVSITNSWNAAKDGGLVRNGVVDIAVDAYDDAGIDRVELIVNGAVVTTDTTSPYVLEWDMTSIADGSVSKMAVRAVDGHGNKAMTGDVTVTKGNNSAPAVTFTSPADGLSIQQGTSVNFAGTATDAEDGALTDSQIKWVSNLQGTLGQGSSLDHRGLVIGTHTISMVAYDSDGVETEQSITVTVAENSLSYATVEKGSYYIAEPLFKRSPVRLTKGFYISKTEMAVQEFLELMAIAEGSEKNARKWADKRNKKLYDTKKEEGLYFPLFEYSGSGDDAIATTYANYPATFIYYMEAVRACNAASERDGYQPAYIYLDKNGDPLDGYGSKVKGVMYDSSADGWRLPTEAEWEIAARAGYTGYKFPWGDTGPGGMCNSMTDQIPPNPVDFVNGRGTCPVVSYEINRYGLYNVVGNAAEMCTDMYIGVPPSGVDPVGHVDENSPRYTVKGGAWYEYGAHMQIALRAITIPFTDREKDSYGSGIGFRMVRSAD